MILAVLQARMASTRLPGKILRPLLDAPMLLQQWRRITRSKMISSFVVATSDTADDDITEAFCLHHGLPVVRGAHHDVLSRFIQVVDAYPEARHVVRLTADCPLADPEVIDACIRLHLSAQADYTSNCFERSYPKGLDAEIMTIETLRGLGREVVAADEREHVTLHIYRHPEKFRTASERQTDDDSAMRWTVDTRDDFSMVEEVYRALYPSNPEFSWRDVKAFLAAHPQIRALNAPLHSLGNCKSRGLH